MNSVPILTQALYIMQLSKKQKQLILEALEDLMYKIAIQLDNYKGGPMDPARTELDKKQKALEKLVHHIEKSS